jgi:hypothetical protein
VRGVLRAAAPHPAQGCHVLLRGAARVHAERRGDLEVVERVLQGPLGVALVGRAPLVLVGIQQVRRGVTVQDERELPAEVVRVVDRAGQSQPAGGRVAVRGVAEQEHPARPERRCHDRIDRPPGDLVDLHRVIGQAERAPGVRLDLGVGLGARVIGRVVEVDHPFLRARSPVVRAHRDQHEQGSGLR